MKSKWIKKILLIFVLGFAVYFPSLFFDFTYFDDQVLILENLSFLKKLSNFWRVFGGEVFHPYQSFGFYYRPILTLSFMIDARFSAASPFFYHFSNIIYHLIASFLLFLFLKKISKKENLSFILTLVFLVHPVLTQAVSWIPGRNDSLLTIFTLCCFLSLMEYLNNERRLLMIFFHFIFFFLALLTKESSLAIPFLSIIFIIFFNFQKIFFLLPLFVGWWVMSLLWIILRINAIKNMFYLSFQQMINSLILNSPALIQYMGKAFFPINLSVLPTIKDTSFLWGGIAFLILILVFIFLKKEIKLFVFGLLWFVLFLIPNFIRPDPQITADFLEHRIYLPLIGFFISLLSFIKLKEDGWHNFIFYFLILIFALMTFFHQFKFKNRLVFWQSAVISSPNSSLAHRNYGVMLYFEKKFSEAEKEYFKALKINPKEPMVYNNLGVIYMNQKKWEKAIESFKKELEINPNYDHALYNLGVVYYQIKEEEKARNLWEKVIEVNPYYLSAYLNLANYYQKQNQKEKTIYYFLLYQKLKEER